MSMTLGEMADQVLFKVGTQDDESREVCKGFLSRRYKLVWDSRLWRETVTVISPTLTAGQQDFILTTAPAIERILQICRSDQELLNPVEWSALWLESPEAFANTAGTPTQFTLRRPSAATALPDTLETKTLKVMNGNLNSTVVTITGLALDSSTYRPHTIAVTCNPNLIDSTFAPRFREIWSVTANRTNIEDIDVAYATDDTVIATISEQHTKADVFPAFRLWNPLPSGTTLRILGKLPCPGFLGSDFDPQLDGTQAHPRTYLEGAAPLIPGIEEALIEYAQFDMLERMRQHGKAQGAFLRAQGIIKQLVERELAQTAGIARVIPWVEGQPVEAPSSKAFF